MKHKMPHNGDQALLYGWVATLPCQRCGSSGVQISHSNQSAHGKGMGLRAYPWCIAALCPSCHIDIDSGSLMTRAERIDAWNNAHVKTLHALFEQALVRPVSTTLGN
jgi:hypothetical protein